MTDVSMLMDVGLVIFLEITGVLLIQLFHHNANCREMKMIFVVTNQNVTSSTPQALPLWVSLIFC